MTKTQQNRGLATFYIRESFKKDFERFLKVIEKDPMLIALRYKPRDGLFSIAVTQLILSYLDRVDPEFKEVDENDDAN